MLFTNEAVEVKYAGQTIRGYAIKVTPDTVTVEASFGTREFPRTNVKGLKFMKVTPESRKQVYEDAMNH